MLAQLGLTLTGSKCHKGNELPRNGPPRSMRNLLLLLLPIPLPRRLWRLVRSMPAAPRHRTPPSIGADRRPRLQISLSMSVGQKYRLQYSSQQEYTKNTQMHNAYGKQRKNYHGVDSHARLISHVTMPSLVRLCKTYDNQIWKSRISTSTKL